MNNFIDADYTLFACTFHLHSRMLTLCHSLYLSPHSSDNFSVAGYQQSSKCFFISLYIVLQSEQHPDHSFLNDIYPQHFQQHWSFDLQYIILHIFA